MGINDIVEELKGQVQEWRLRISRTTNPVGPHPSRRILYFLDQLYHSPDFPKNLDLRCKELCAEIECVIPKWPSLEYGDDYKLPVLDHLKNFTDILLKTQPSDGEWSRPMSQANMMSILRIDSRRKFKAFAREYGIRQVGGSRQLWQIRIDRMDSVARSKLN